MGGYRSIGVVPVYAALKRSIESLVRIFFREVDVSGLEDVPARGGGIVVSWHPNGLIDPALILSQLPRRVVFGARDGLFKWPGLGWLMRALGTVPIYRAVDASDGSDPDARRAANRRTLAALAGEIVDGSFVALFPEGVSHDESGLVELRTGVARLYYQAREATPAGSPAPVILPVGLFYDRKDRFRSRARVAFHPPIAIPPELDVDPSPSEPEEVARERARALTLLVDRVLTEAVGATEDWATHDALERVRSLVAAERVHRSGEPLAGTSSLEQEAGAFSLVRAAYYAAREREPERIRVLRRDVEQYDRDLRNLGLADADLDRDPRLASPWLLWLILAQAVFVFLLLPPFLALGFLVNAPVAFAVRGLALLTAKLKKDAASMKVLIGVVLFPLAWLLVGVAGYRLHRRIDEELMLPDAPVLAGALLSFLSIVGGAAAYRYLRVAQETARSVRVRLTRRRRSYTVARLRKERGRLHDEIRSLLARRTTAHAVHTG